MSFQPLLLELAGSTKLGKLFNHATDSIQGFLTVDSLTARNNTNATSERSKAHHNISRAHCSP